MDIRIDLHEVRDNSHLSLGAACVAVSHTASATMLKHHGYINYLSVETRSPVPQAVKMLAQFGPAPAPGLAIPLILAIPLHPARDSLCSRPPRRISLSLFKINGWLLSH